MDKRTTAAPDPRELSISERLMLTRAALGPGGWSQRFLCQVTGIAPNAWNNYERRGQRPSIDEVLKLAPLGIDPGWVYLGLLGNVRSDVRDKIQVLLLPGNHDAWKPIKRRPARR